MALITSAASGNFNAGATWTGGVVPGVGDEARASTGHTVTINVNTTCDEISNAGTGIFTLADGVTLTANVSNKSTTTNRSILQFTAASPAVGNVVGNVTGQATNNTISVGAVVNTSSGTLNVTGNVTAGSQQCAGVANTSTGTLNVTGNVTAGTGIGTFGASNTSTGSLTITGNVTAGTSATCHGANNGGTGTLTITGNVTAGSSTGVGAFNNSTGTLSVIGTIQATQTAAGVAGTNAQQVTILSGPFLTETTRGVAPVYCAAWRWNASPSNSTYMEVMTNDLLVKRNLYTADNITGMPAASNVKSGITYGPSSELTGTFEQTVSPSIEGIAAGVWDYAISSITTSDTIGLLLKTNIDATISSRSTATTAGIADAVWDEVMSGHTINGTYGDRIVRSLNSNNTLQLTGSHHAAADVHEFQPDVITNNAIAASAITEIATGVRTELATELTAITELHLIHGLKSGSTLTVTPTSRSAGAVSQTIGGDGTTSTTVSRD